MIVYISLPIYLSFIYLCMSLTALLFRYYEQFPRWWRSMLRQILWWTEEVLGPVNTKTRAAINSSLPDFFAIAIYGNWSERALGFICSAGHMWLAPNVWVRRPVGIIAQLIASFWSDYEYEYDREISSLGVVRMLYNVTGHANLLATSFLGNLVVALRVER